MKNFVFAAAAFAAVSAPANAAVVLDQNALNAPGFYGGFQVTASPSPFGYREAGQTVTVGLTGVLSRIDLLIGGDAAYNVRLSIRPVTSGIVNSSNASRLATFDLVSPFWGRSISYAVTQVNVSAANLFFTAGDSFAITLESLGGPSGNGGWASAAAQYPGGTGVNRTSNSDAWQTSGDLSFATYVNTPAVPEPATWAMLIAGFGAVGGAMRRRVRVAVPA